MLYMQKTLILVILAVPLALGWAQDGTGPSAEETAPSEEPTEASPPPEEVPTQAEEAPTQTEGVAAQPWDSARNPRNSIVQIVIMGENGEVNRVGSGFVVAAGGQVLTAAHLVLNESRIIVAPLATGAELVARIIHSNERSDLALLAVNGLGLSPLQLATDGFAPGRLVYSAGVWNPSGESLLVASADELVPVAIAGGAVGEHIEIPAEADTPAVGLIQHNAMIPAAGYGGPLLNECGEVAGVNRGSPDMPVWRLRRGQAPEGVVYAANVAAIAGLLQPAGIAFAQSETSCAEARAVAQAQAEQAQTQAEQAQTQADQAQTQAEQAQAQAEQAQAQADDAARQAEEKGQQLEQRQQELEAAAARVSDLEEQYQEAVRTGAAEAESLRTNLDGARGERDIAQAAVASLENDLAALQAQRTQEAEAEQRRLIAIVTAAVFVVLLVVIVAVLAHRKRLQELAHAQQQAVHARQEAQRARAEAHVPDFPDCLLSGKTGEGRSVSVKMPGSLLAGDGVVVGRSPRHSTFLVDDETMSREHARFFAEDDSLCIEDLGTTNGTQVNGRRVQPRTSTPLREGDVVELGAVRMQVAWTNQER